MTRRGRTIAIFVLVGCIAMLAAFWICLLLNQTRALSILLVTDCTVLKPRAFGGFHFLSLGVCVFICILFGFWGTKRGRKHTDTVVFTAGLLLLFLELYKQFYSYFILNDRVYDFGFLPFQFCSLPLYLYLTVPFLREGRVKELFYRFLALYGTMGACLVMVYPAFYDRASLCVHTMLWHTVMLAVGVFLLFARGYGSSWKREVLLPAIPFVIFFFIATCINVFLTPHIVHSPNPLNLYYMSPYVQPTRYFVIRDVQMQFGWGVSLLCYLLFFVFVGATLVFFVTKLLRLLGKCLKKSKKI